MPYKNLIVFALFAPTHSVLKNIFSDLFPKSQYPISWVSHCQAWIPSWNGIKNCTQMYVVYLTQAKFYHMTSVCDLKQTGSTAVGVQSPKQPSPAVTFCRLNIAWSPIQVSLPLTLCHSFSMAQEIIHSDVIQGLTQNERYKSLQCFGCVVSYPIQPHGQIPLSCVVDEIFDQMLTWLTQSHLLKLCMGRP